MTQDAATRETLAQQARVVLVYRSMVARLKSRRDELLAELQAKEEVFIDLGISQGWLDEAEAQLRELTLAAYAESGDKAPGPGVGIRVAQQVQYDAAEAFAWGREHGGIALQLDKKEFERIARELNTLPARAGESSFVTLTEVVTATIATDLAKALEP